MTETQAETFTNAEVGQKTFQRFAALKRNGILLDTHINVSPSTLLSSKYTRTGHEWRRHTGA